MVSSGPCFQVAFVTDTFYAGEMRPASHKLASNEIWDNEDRSAEKRIRSDSDASLPEDSNSREEEVRPVFEICITMQVVTSPEAWLMQLLMWTLQGIL